MSVIVFVLVVLLAMSFVVPGRNEWQLFRRFNVVAHGGGNAVCCSTAVFAESTPQNAIAKTSGHRWRQRDETRGCWLGGGKGREGKVEINRVR